MVTTLAVKTEAVRTDLKSVGNSRPSSILGAGTSTLFLYTQADIRLGISFLIFLWSYIPYSSNSAGFTAMRVNDLSDLEEVILEECEEYLGFFLYPDNKLIAANKDGKLINVKNR